MRSGQRETGRQSSVGEDFRREPTLGPSPSARTQSTARPNVSNDMPDSSQGVRFFTTQGTPLEKDVMPPLSILPNASSKPASSSSSHHMDAVDGNSHAAHTGSIDGQTPFMPGMQPFMNSSADPAAGVFPHRMEHGSPAGQMIGEKSSSSLHAALIVIIIAAGLAIGLVRAIWINDEREAKSAQEILANRMPLPPVMPESSGSKPTQDPQSYMPPPAEPTAELTEKETPSSLSPEPENQESMSETDPVKSGGQLSSALSMPKEIEESAKEEKPDTEPTPPAEIKEVAPVQPRQAKTAARSEKAQPEKKRKSRSEHKSRKLAESSRKDRIKEIDRVRTQAYSESSKDRVGESRPSSSENRVGPQSQNRKSYRPSQIAQRTVTSSEYARCERNSNIIDRERCKWELCNHKWGKGGCPSFKTEKAYVF